MGNFFLTSMSDVSCPLLLHPEWSYRDQQSQIQSQHRTQSGRLFSYLWGNFAKFHVPLRFVTSADQSLINAWWQGQDDVAFTLNSSEAKSTVMCRIVNDGKPINRFVQPYDDLYAGDLSLEAIADVPRTGRPFILDDEVSGLLNQNYNVLR